MLFKITDANAGPNAQVKHTEFKTFYPAINRNMEWCTIEPFVQQAEDSEIIPAIGLAFYDVLNDEYQTDGTIADATKAYTFRLLRTALAHYAIYLALPQLNIRVGDAGTNETSASDITPVRQWVFNISRWEVAKTAYRYLDMALAHMESQVIALNPDYDTFLNSEAYTESKELLIPNARKFQRFYNLQTSRRAYTTLRPYIRKAEAIYLKPMLCTFFDELKTQHTTNTLTAENASILPLVQQLLAEYTVILALPDLNFVNDGDGWRVMENQYGMNESSNLKASMQQMHTRAEQNAAAYEILLKNELYATLDDYPTYRDSPCNELTQDTDGDGITDAEELACNGDEYQEYGAVIL